MAKGQTKASSAPSAAREQQVRARLTELMQSLEQMQSIVHVATAALEHQNADRDEDVARVLRRGVADRISAELEKTAALLGSLRKTR